MKSLISTKDLGVINATNFENMFASGSSSTFYALIGKQTEWANSDNDVVTAYDTTQSKLDVLNNGIFLKRITSNDLHPIVPRVDWVSSTIYFPYDQNANLFVKVLSTQVSGGNVNVSISLANTVNANGINFNSASPALTVGSIIKIGDESKEIVKINTAGDFLQVNTNFSSSYTKANLFKITTSTTQYANKFYVRNSVDQVFKCLFNNSNTASIYEPTTSISGALPSNPYITTSDGYKWRYLYTIPAGLKQKFFTADYMPVYTEGTTYNNPVDGRIDIVNILDGGSGYYDGMSTNNYSVVTVTGDGTGAQMTVNVASGVITGINILDGGSGYTHANVTISDALQNQITGNAASLFAVIGPKGGHGSDLLDELGASYRMLSVDFDSDIGGLLPVDNSGNDDFRQFAIVKNPKLRSNGAIALNATGYNMCAEIVISSSSTFLPGHIVYVGTSLANSVFSGTVAHYDSTEKILYLNNLNGTLSQTVLVNESIKRSDDVSSSGTIIQVTPSDINTLSGQVLYIENRAKVIRNPDQIESTRIVFAF